MANNSSTSSKSSLDNREMIVFWSVIYLVECFLICLGNSLSIVVFWRRRRSLRRTSYLLINLAVADLGLGVFTGTSTIVVPLWPSYFILLNIIRAIIMVHTFASIFSLTLVSLETAYAMVFPFRHRTVGRRPYCFAITLVWLLAALHSAMWFIVLTFFNGTFFLQVSGITAAICLVCLILMPSSYLLIWWFVSNRPTRQMRERKQRKKLAVTLFVVTVLSLMTWIPGPLSFLILSQKELQGFNAVRTVSILFAVVLVNSFLNPLVYTFRMPEFRREIKFIICKTTEV